MGTTSKSNKSIKTLLEHIDSNELVLPEIQRDFVWSKKNVLLLAVSRISKIVLFDFMSSSKKYNYVEIL